MNGRTAKLHRQAVQKGAEKAIVTVAPAIEAIAGMGQMTRGRVDKLEAFQARGLAGRLRWLLTGK